MTIPDVYRPVVLNLLKRTLDQAVEWREGADKLEFIASFRDWSIKIRDTEDENNYSYSLSLLDREGSLTDEFAVWPSSDNEDYQILESIFDAARRRALKIDEALATIQEELGEPDDLPFE